MIVIKLEMWPNGVEAHAYALGRAFLTNDGTSSDARRGNYDGAIMAKGELRSPHVAPASVGRRARIEDYPRLSNVVWVLVQRFLNAAMKPEGVANPRKAKQ